MSLSRPLHHLVDAAAVEADGRPLEADEDGPAEPHGEFAEVVRE